MKIFVIIVTYNGLKWIDKCISSCNKYPIIVVDNNSSDQTVKYIQDNFPHVKLIKSNKNLGFGAANNIGIKYALKNKADYVFLLNQDCYLKNDSLKKLISSHKGNKKYGILSPIHLNGSGNKLDEKFSYYLGYNETPKIFSD